MVFMIYMLGIWVFSDLRILVFLDRWLREFDSLEFWV